MTAADCADTRSNAPRRTQRYLRDVPLGRGGARLAARRRAGAVPDEAEPARAVRPAAAAGRAHLALRGGRGAARAPDRDPLHRRAAAVRPAAQLRLHADLALVDRVRRLAGGGRADRERRGAVGLPRRRARRLGGHRLRAVRARRGRADGDRSRRGVLRGGGGAVRDLVADAAVRAPRPRRLAPGAGRRARR